ncbi:MAG: tRNA (N6-threonylcarbamoyladenosine(37)-N6)-methyltransferase TrmO [Oscillatoriales cyanobacterium SM2_2_1]|nr:tRNA (N6-threonylcarbamoyladenosine(37)-N6)-methyltransferase TrmO [Oscillatoriales cyanobacterium SM2_2_1]
MIQSSTSEIRYLPIGTIYSPFKSPSGMPIQTVSVNTTEGTVEILAEFEEALQDLDGFSHIFLLYHFHLAKPFQPLVTPFIDKERRGLFATRSPARPNAIGVSVVELLGIADRILSIRGIDVINATPLLDIKPYIPEFDMRSSCRIGWATDQVFHANSTCADHRFLREEL